jgi:hypothetical protein
MLYDESYSNIDDPRILRFSRSTRSTHATLTDLALVASLAKVLPISLSRAGHCADRLARLSDGGRESVDMSEFYLHETQAQLQLAMFGEKVRECVRARACAVTGDTASSVL